MLFIAKPAVNLFTQDTKVIELTVYYLIIMTFASIGLNLYNFTNQSLNALGLASKALKINAFGTFFIIVPLMIIGSRISFLFLISGLALGQIIVGNISMFYAKYKLSPKRLELLL
jgi:Na+-driven multidrug efflux pump